MLKLDSTTPPTPVRALDHANVQDATPVLVPAPRTLASDIRAALDHPVWGWPLAVLLIAPFGLMLGAVVARIVGM